MSAAHRRAFVQGHQMPHRAGARQTLQPWQHASAPDVLEVMGGGFTLECSSHPTPHPLSIRPFDYSESDFTELRCCKPDHLHLFIFNAFLFVYLLVRT